MSTRLTSGGKLIDRSCPLEFQFNDKRFKGFHGDTVASALLAGNQRIVGRSFKYHRPRGIVASGTEEPNALVTIGKDAFHEPNQRATTIPVRDGMFIKSQNHWPSLKFDAGIISNYLSNFLTAGFYYKTFIRPRFAWKHIFEPAIRNAAGLGQAPSDRDLDNYEHFHVYVDVLIVGAGLAGIVSARTLAPTGLSILLLEQSNFAGGRSSVDHETLEGKPSSEWISRQIEHLKTFKNVHLRMQTTANGVYDHGYVIADEVINRCNQNNDTISRRLWRIRANKIILASGEIERPLCFSGNDKPGVMLASAVRDFVVNYGVSPGDRTVIMTNNDDAYRTAIVLNKAGLDVPLILDVRHESGTNLPKTVRNLGIRVENNRGIAEVIGRNRVEGVRICTQAGEGVALETVACESVAMSGGWSPAVHLWSHCGGKNYWEEECMRLLPDLNHPPISDDGETLVIPVGGTMGEICANSIADSAVKACRIVAQKFGKEISEIDVQNFLMETEAKIVSSWLVPQGMSSKDRSRTWVDFQNDVKVSDIDLAVREGYESSEHAKRYTTLGMATDQGKTSNINGLAVLSMALDQPMGKSGTTTFRPPYVPMPFGSIVGLARGNLFMPIRKTPLDNWHDEHGAFWEPVATWRRPFCYKKADESIEQAVNRESLRVRSTVGMLDATTLGKLLVKGPDAGKFLDMIYTNMISNLKPGRCRYGLMCNENGFLIDDGVVACIDNETFLCHITSGGADNIHSWMEEWLQTEWWDWQVYTINLTEQFSQIGIAGPDARSVLEKIGGMDLDAESLPFMSWASGNLGGFDVNIYRISFSGELSFEIAVPNKHALDLWNAIYQAGEEFEIETYGTEALHVLRAEKGFIMIGEETDGTVIPQDLGLDWALSKKKSDFIGKRGQERSFLNEPNRWKLVGLESPDYKVQLPAGAHAISDEICEFGHKKIIGRVTSSYFSPVLNRTIAMGLIESGPSRVGEILEFVDGETHIKAKIVSTVFYDPEGTQLHG